jgi:hypothetical protein
MLAAGTDDVDDQIGLGTTADDEAFTAERKAEAGTLAGNGAQTQSHGGGLLIRGGEKGEVLRCNGTTVEGAVTDRNAFVQTL